MACCFKDILKTFSHIKCPASFRWALSWENTDICHIYTIYIYIYSWVHRWVKSVVCFTHLSLSCFVHYRVIAESDCTMNSGQCSFFQLTQKHYYYCSNSSNACRVTCGILKGYSFIFGCQLGEPYGFPMSINVMWILVFTKYFSVPVSLLYSVGNKSHCFFYTSNQWLLTNWSIYTPASCKIF